MNLSSGLEANSNPRETLVSEETKNAVGEMSCAFVAWDPTTVKNREQPVKIFEVNWRRM